MHDDEMRFTALVERHRRELQVHCYRMLGSFEESQDAVQEAFLRAWRSRATVRTHLPARRSDWAAPTDDERALLRRFMEHNERSEVDALVALLAEHVRQTMPPLPHVTEGRAAILEDCFEPCTLDVLRIEDGLVTEVTTFDRTVFAYLGLPERH